MKNIKYIAALLLLSCISANGFAQCDSTAFYANKYMSKIFVPDGQSYRALIYDDQVAEFSSTFYAGANYRIVAFAGMQKEQVIFSLSDKDGNELFSNAEYSNSPYWDFEFDNTVECKIEARLDESKQKSGCAVLLIGFER